MYALESEDGEHLFYSKSPASGIWRVALAGGDESEVVKEPIDWQDWVLGRRGLYYATTRYLVLFRRRELTIHYLDFTSGHSTVLLHKEGAFAHQGMAVSPDEQWILVGEAPGWQTELMLMENFR